MPIFTKSLVLLCLFLSACATNAVDDDVTLTFLHLNDTYRVGDVEDGTRGGFGRVATVIRNLEDQGRTVRVLHGGDFLYPSLESQLWDGAQMIEAMNFLNELAPLVAVPGNHEFDERTPESSVNAMRGSAFTWVADNMRLATGDPDADGRLVRHHVVTVNGRKIGFLALTIHPDDGGNVRGYTVFEPDYLEAAKRAIEAFEAAGVDLIVGLTHLHLADDIEIAKLKAAHPKFLFIVGGHEHEPEHERGTRGTAEIMKGASNARTIWQIDVRFAGDGAPSIETRQIDMTREIARDADYQRIADKWQARLLEKMPFLPSKIGEAALPLDGREVAVRNGESNWGNFIADQMLTAFGQPPADLAFVNGGTLRIDDFIAGDITYEDLGRTFGFSSFLAYLQMSGQEFRTMLEAGYRGLGPSKGYFPQVAGFRVCIDRSRPDGKRIAQLQVPTEAGWRQIEDDRDYTVVAPDFVLRGGDGYAFPGHRARSRPGSELKYLVLDAIIRAQAAGEKIGAPVDPANPRVAFVPGPGGRCFD